MAKTTDSNRALDLTLSLGRSLFSSPDLDRLRDLLTARMPAWASNLHVSQQKKRRELQEFAPSIRAIATERGPLHAALTGGQGAGPFERRTGSVELRGADDALVVVVILDDYLVAPLAGAWRIANTITFQVRRGRVAGEDAETFVRGLADAACAELSPWHAHAQSQAEWDARNMLTEGGLRAVGIDATRYLPGLYWLNFFGEPYRQLIGRDRLLSAPAHETRELDAGVLVQVDPTSSAWTAPESRHRSVLAHIGEQYFFDRSVPDRPTVAPDFSSAMPRATPS